MLFGRDGKPLASDNAAGLFSTFTDGGNYLELNLSPDRNSLAMAAGGAARRDVYLLDLIRKINTRFTFDPADDRSPVWSHDGKQIVFASTREGVPGDLYIKPSNGARNEEVLLKSPAPKTPTDWSANGGFLLYSVADDKTRTDIWYVPTSGDRKPMPFIQTPYNEGQGQFSPDGRFVVYNSDESGRPEIYVRSFPDANGKWQISRGGGVDPRWRRDGKEIIYLSAQRVMGVDVTSTPTFVPGSPKPLFDAPIVQAGANARNPAYVVAADGKSFLASVPLAPNASAPINVVLNWLEELNQSRRSTH